MLGWTGHYFSIGKLILEYNFYIIYIILYKFKHESVEEVYNNKQQAKKSLRRLLPDQKLKMWQENMISRQVVSKIKKQKHYIVSFSKSVHDARIINYL